MKEKITHFYKNSIFSQHFTLFIYYNIQFIQEKE